MYGTLDRQRSGRGGERPSERRVTSTGASAVRLFHLRHTLVLFLSTHRSTSSHILVEYEVDIDA